MYIKGSNISLRLVKRTRALTILLNKLTFSVFRKMRIYGVVSTLAFSQCIHFIES